MEEQQEPPQQVTTIMPPSQDVGSLSFLESFVPFQFDEKTGNLIYGNIPQALLEENWESLNQHVALGNFSEDDIKTVYYMTKRNILSTIHATPKRKFSVHRIRELQKVKYAAFLLSTKSKLEGERDRKLIPAVVHLTESKTAFKEETAAKKKRFGGGLNPLNWFG